MNFKELDSKISLNKTRIEKIGYKKNMCDYEQNNRFLINSILRQIQTNITCILSKFEHLSADELVTETRKNCIKRFELDFYNSKNTEAAINHIEKQKRKEAKSKLLYIKNVLWLYLNYSKM